MTWELVLRQGVLFAHLVAFAIAISTVLREDWMLISTRRIAWHRLVATARALTISLVALWATGGALVALDVGLSFAAIGANAKLTAKLLVVLALTVNGFALHAIAFPMIRRAHRARQKGADDCSLRAWRRQHGKLAVRVIRRRSAANCAVNDGLWVHGWLCAARHFVHRRCFDAFAFTVIRHRRFSQARRRRIAFDELSEEGLQLKSHAGALKPTLKGDRIRAEGPLPDS